MPVACPAASAAIVATEASLDLALGARRLGHWVPLCMAVAFLITGWRTAARDLAG
jgi:hypothetical protein